MQAREVNTSEPRDVKVEQVGKVGEQNCYNCSKLT